MLGQIKVIHNLKYNIADENLIMWLFLEQSYCSKYAFYSVSCIKFLKNPDCIIRMS